MVAAVFAVLATVGAFLAIAMLRRVPPGQPPPSLASVLSFIAAYGLMAASGAQLARAAFGLWFLLPMREFI